MAKSDEVQSSFLWFGLIAPRRSHEGGSNLGQRRHDPHEIDSSLAQQITEAKTGTEAPFLVLEASPQSASRRVIMALILSSISEGE